MSVLLGVRVFPKQDFCFLKHVPADACRRRELADVRQQTLARTHGGSQRKDCDCDSDREGNSIE